MSFCRLIAAAANGKSVCNPTQVLAVGSIQDDTKVDEWSSATLQFEGGIGASVFTSVFIDGDNRVEVLGSKGSLTVENIWRPDLPQLGKVQIIHGGSETKVIEVPLEETNLFAYEADAVADAISQGQQECQYMTWEDTLGQVKAMDAWRKAIGLTYKEDSQ
jgi:predicted dehydrogenase